ncbi:divergent polysaccharide deacetylase family protein [Bacillus sp. FJAT-29790]|uniref:divergent polysaccharide deacetylase family protein n=1 Tax=Bacillus sp. FJAT-29790 TaxID=1895002 RepID=UPI001C2197DC|nr:divergent polysaccharide deacetylase family protein [Bacillus sp. FJAT-29790]MBU8878615.1 divergent polysaccharide deacetylase family protein [Bacillus sp. FJAT-29790]
MKNWICSLFLLFSIIQPALAQSLPTQKKDLALVIDDLGNNMKGTVEMLNLPVTLNVAIMPFLPSTKEDAELAYHNGHEVIVHLPMEPKKGKKSWLGPGAITTDLSDEEIRKRVVAAIKDVPHAVGINHHMGSKATEDERVMKIVLEVCKGNGLFYLDSKTTGKSVVSKLATEMGVPFLENNLFFDDIYTTQHIKKQASRLAGKLSENDRLIAIGHVGIAGPKMVKVLEEYIPVYQNKANIVALSELIPGYELIDKGP